MNCNCDTLTAGTRLAFFQDCLSIVQNRVWIDRFYVLNCASAKKNLITSVFQSFTTRTHEPASRPAGPQVRPNGRETPTRIFVRPVTMLQHCMPRNTFEMDCADLTWAIISRLPCSERRGIRMTKLHTLCRSHPDCRARGSASSIRCWTAL